VRDECAQGVFCGVEEEGEGPGDVCDVSDAVAGGGDGDGGGGVEGEGEGGEGWVC